jgi:hypothetical protein
MKILLKVQKVLEPRESIEILQSFESFLKNKNKNKMKNKNKNIKKQNKKRKTKSKKHKLIFFYLYIIYTASCTTKTIYNDRQSKFGYIDACD